MKHCSRWERSDENGKIIQAGDTKEAEIEQTEHLTAYNLLLGFSPVSQDDEDEGEAKLTRCSSKLEEKFQKRRSTMGQE